MKHLVFVVIAGLFLTMTGCDPSRVYEDQATFTRRQWRMAETPLFRFTVPDTGRYNLYLNVRSSIDYPWSRVFVLYRLTDSTEHELSSRLITADLFEENGKPLGESGLGDVYDTRFPLLEHYRFPGAGQYAMRIEHRMRQDTLLGIVSAGIRVERDLPNQ